MPIIFTILEERTKRQINFFKAPSLLLLYFKVKGVGVVNLFQAFLCLCKQKKKEKVILRCMSKII